MSPFGLNIAFFASSFLFIDFSHKAHLQHIYFYSFPFILASCTSGSQPGRFSPPGGIWKCLETTGEEVLLASSGEAGEAATHPTRYKAALQSEESSSPKRQQCQERDTLLCSRGNTIFFVVVHIKCVLLGACIFNLWK